MKIAIGIAHGHSIKIDTMMSILNMIFSTRTSAIRAARENRAVTARDQAFDQTHPTQVKVIPVGHVYVGENRWHIATDALKWGADYLLFVDTDMEFPADALIKMLALKKPIVGVHYSTKSQDNPVSTVKMLGDGPLGQLIVPQDGMPSEPFQAWGAGTGLLLIDTAVLRGTPQPWFGMTWGPDGKMEMGEDTFFCYQAGRAGFETWVDPRIPIYHIGDWKYGKPGANLVTDIDHTQLTEPVSV